MGTLPYFKIIFGSVSALGAQYTVNVQLVDVETAVIEGIREVQCRRCSVEDLSDVVAALYPWLVERR